MRSLLVLAVLSLFDQGVKLRDVAEYAQAADAFERFARESPTDESAPRALSDAIVLRLGLGDDRKADEDAEQYLKAYATRREDAAKVALAIVLHASEKDDWAKVERDGAQKMAVIERGPLPLVMVAHAVMGRAFARHPGDARASREYARVRAMGEHAPPPPSDSEGLRQWAKGADAFAEALVFAADEKRDATTWSAFPAYGGGDVDGWIQNEVQPWITARIAAIRTLSDAYEKVVDMQPVPPPRWAVTASARVAQLRTRTWDEMFARATKSTKPKLEIAARPLEAKPAALACVALSVKYQWSDDASRACGAWLEKTYRRELPPLDELVPRLRDANPIRVDPLRP